VAAPREAPKLHCLQILIGPLPRRLRVYSSGDQGLQRARPAEEARAFEWTDLQFTAGHLCGSIYKLDNATMQRCKARCPEEKLQRGACLEAEEVFGRGYSKGRARRLDGGAVLLAIHLADAEAVAAKEARQMEPAAEDDQLT
jgi:hypothetical protein